MLKSVGLTFTSKLVAAIINFLIIVLLSRILGADGKGACSFYLLIFSTSLIFCEFISGSTVVYLLAKFSHRQLLIVFYTWSIPCSIIIGLIFYWLHKITSTELWWIVLLNWLNAAVAYNQLIALGSKKISLYNTLNILQAALSLIAIYICFTYYKASPIYYLFSIAIAWAITFFVSLVALAFLPNLMPAAPFKTLVTTGFKAGIANQTGTLLQLINTRIGYLLIAGTELGIYSNAVSLCEAALLINNSIGTIQYSKIANQKNRAAQVALTHNCFWINAAFMLLALVVLFMLPNSFYTLLFGADFYGVATPIRLLIPGIFLYSGFIIFSYFFSGTGRFLHNNFPAMAGLGITAIGYSAAKLIGIPITMPFVAIMLVFSYMSIFSMALILFLKVENIALKKWFTLPNWQAIKSML
jgi:O-antigen/teichoic acid export membrane protein